MEDLIPIFAIFFVIGVPVMSIAARFVLRPLLLDITQAIRGGKAGELNELRERFSRLENHLSAQDQRIDQLVEAELFRRQLEAGPSAPAASKPAGGVPAAETPPSWG
jgi:hypothetical protein